MTTIKFTWLIMFFRKINGTRVKVFQFLLHLVLPKSNTISEFFVRINYYSLSLGRPKYLPFFSIYDRKITDLVSKVWFSKLMFLFFVTDESRLMPKSVYHL